jgi:hypothetical protein
MKSMIRAARYLLIGLLWMVVMVMSYAAGVCTAELLSALGWLTLLPYPRAPDRNSGCPCLGLAHFSISLCSVGDRNDQAS